MAEWDLGSCISCQTLHLQPPAPTCQTEANHLMYRDTWRLEFDSSIVPKCPEKGRNEYIRNTIYRLFNAHMVHYICYNLYNACQREWPTKRVIVVFHTRRTEGQGIVKVRPLHQTCKRCSEAPVEHPDITSENITNLLKNLVKTIRIKCYRENLDQGKYNFVRIEVISRHEPAHCEGSVASCLDDNRVFYF
ncbi:receptor-transporting protein 3-like [Xiphias gladius]|uniref:receptor-transporting protein 3-like n=1 Tax=Xiphias gladius TaxID=8245 RepID=UPI001A99A467|nr:receptor-transporting protein 3-like [Xiphias gladius]